MHTVRRALVQSNRDIGLVDLMQIGGASAEDLEWCTRNGLETSSDLQYISAAHIPKGGALESLWKELQGQPSGMVTAILQTKTITAEAYLDALWTYILGLVRAGVEELQIDPAHPKPMDHRHMIMCKLPCDAR